MAHTKTNPMISDLDEIAEELEKTGHADLAALVDEVGYEIASSPRPVAAAKKPAKKDKDKEKDKEDRKKGKKPAKKDAQVNFNSRRAKVAAAMKKIARAQVAELESIAAELIKDGQKKAALEVLKIAEDLDSDYDYSSEGKHSAPEQKGDASKRFDREKANKPDAKMNAEEKEDLELPYGSKGEGYPVTSEFESTLDALIRMAGGEEDALDAPAPDSDEMEGLEGMEDSEESEEGDESSEESEEEESEEGDESSEESEEGSDEDMNLDVGDSDDADDMDLSGLDLGDGDDELASLMDAMESEPTDMEASDRMYETEAPTPGSEDAEEEMDEEESDEAAPPLAESPLADESEESEEEGEDSKAMNVLPDVEMKFSSADRTKLLSLAQKLASKGKKKLAAKVAQIAKK